MDGVNAKRAFSLAGCCWVCRVGLLAVVAAVSLPPPTWAQTDGSPGENLLSLRIADGELRAAVLDGSERSKTLRNLLTRIGELNAIVYVQWTAALPRGVEAAIEQHVTVTPNVRYLRIGLKPARATDWVVSIIAHELRHAIEILEAEVTDSSAIEALFKRLNHGLTERVYETAAAVETGLVVSRELRNSRR